MDRTQVAKFDIGTAGQLASGVLCRKEAYRLKAGFHARLPMPFQRAFLNRVSKPIFSEQNRARKAIFVHIPKNAGTSLGKAFDLWKPGHYPIVRYAAENPRATRKYFKFAVVRNPWDRLLSAFDYLRRHRQGANFEDAVYTDRYLRQFDDFEIFVHALADIRNRRRMLDFIHMLPQTYWLTLPGSTDLHVDYLGRFEDLSSTFALLTERLGNAGDLPKLNRGNIKNFRDDYTPKMRDIVADIYSCDIEAFGYTFDAPQKREIDA